MPHFGVMPEEDAPVVPYAERKYDVLFTGTYYRYQDKLLEIERMFPKGSDMYRVYQQMFDNLIHNSDLSIEKALLYTLEQFGWSVSEEALKTMFRCAEFIDWAIRTYQRERVITVFAEAGQELYLLGKGGGTIRGSVIRMCIAWTDGSPMDSYFRSRQTQRSV